MTKQGSPATGVILSCSPEKGHSTEASVDSRMLTVFVKRSENPSAGVEAPAEIS